MTATVAPTATTSPTITTTSPTISTSRRSHPVLMATVVSGLVAAAATTAVAATAHAAGVPLAVDGEQIPFLGFAQMALVGAVLGGLIVAALNRWSGRARQHFQVIAATLTVASFIPSVTLPPDTATKLVLVATHLVAAAIIVPALVRRTAR
jgi:hypothetical protein